MHGSTSRSRISLWKDILCSAIIKCRKAAVTHIWEDVMSKYWGLLDWYWFTNHFQVLHHQRDELCFKYTVVFDQLLMSQTKRGTWEYSIWENWDRRHWSCRPAGWSSKTNKHAAVFLKSKASVMFPRRPSSSRENPSLSRRRKLVGAETLHSLIKYLKSRCEIRAFTFELSQQRYFNTTVNVLRTLEYSPGYSRHSRTSRNPIFLHILRRSFTAAHVTELRFIHPAPHQSS